MPCTEFVVGRELAVVFIIMLTHAPIRAVPYLLNRINVPIIIPNLQIPHCTVISVTNEDMLQQLLPIVVTCQLLSLIIAAVVVLVVVVVNIVDVMRNQRDDAKHEAYYTSDRSYNTPVRPTSDHQNSSSHSPPSFEPPNSFPFFSRVLRHVFNLDHHRRFNRWIFDTGRTAHSAFLPTKF